jgi:hypothetical protein
MYNKKELLEIMVIGYEEVAREIMIHSLAYLSRSEFNMYALRNGFTSLGKYWVLCPHGNCYKEELSKIKEV